LLFGWAFGICIHGSGAAVQEVVQLFGTAYRLSYDMVFFVPLYDRICIFINYHRYWR